ncbi:MAG TPA: YqiA/YcfP family alpha/beta fold hydrolase [Polyangiaceae bacterium]
MTKFLYLHGFASGPDSKKGVAISAHLATRGIAVQRLNLRVPSFEHLRLSAMIETARAAIGGADDRAVVLGSSLGGLTAARLAERDARVVALVLLAPAFQLVSQWRTRDGGAEWRDAEERGWFEVDDLVHGGRARVDFEFTNDVARVDSTPFPDVRVPTLIVHGSRDDVVAFDRSRDFAKDRPDVRLVPVDDGHDLGASLDRITTEIDAFFREHRIA